MGRTFKVELDYKLILQYQRMLLTNSINKHKADIQKRIQQLESKLKAPHLKLYPETTVPHHRQEYRPPQPYIQPSQISQLRKTYSKQRNHQSRPYQYGNQNQQPIDYRHREIRRQPFANHSFNEGRIAKNIPKPQPIKQTRDDIYGMMEMIIEGQKNLEKQLCLLKSQWSKDQSNRQPGERKKYEEIIHSKIQQRPMTQSIHTENKQYEDRKRTIKKQSERNSIEESRKVEKKEPTRPKPPPKRPKENKIDIAALVQNQKSRSERLVVNEELKNEGWRLIEMRIRESENEYKDSIHRNNKHEHEHLIYTNQLQRKLKDDLMAKIYSQCNKCVYK